MGKAYVFHFRGTSRYGPTPQYCKKKGIGRLIGQAAYLPSEQAGKLPPWETAC